MSRRRILWAVVAALAGLTIGLFFAAKSARAASVPPVPDPTSAVDAFGVYGFAFIVASLVVYHVIVGVYRAVRVVGRAVEWQRNGPPKRAVEPAVKPPAGLPNGNTFDAPVPEALAEFDANLDPAIAARLQRKAAYDEAASVMWTAQRELADDRLIGNVIDLWGRTSKP